MCPFDLEQSRLNPNNCTKRVRRIELGLKAIDLDEAVAATR